MIDGRLDDADRMGALAAAAVSADDPTAGLAIFAQRLGIARERGHYGELLSQIEVIATLPEFPGVKAEVAHAHLGLGRRDDARVVLDEFRSTDFATVPRNWGRPSALQDLVELATVFDDTAAATALLPLLGPYRGQILVAYGAASCRGAADRAAGQLLLTLGRAEEAIVALGSARASSSNASVVARSSPAPDCGRPEHCSRAMHRATSTAPETSSPTSRPKRRRWGWSALLPRPRT